MEDKKELFKITINNFSEYIRKTQKVRPVPYIRGKCRLPKKYESEEDFEWRKIKYWGRNVEARYEKGKSDKEFLISNNKTANKERHVKVNGQEVYNQTGGSFNRAFMRDQLHNYFKKHLKDVKPIDDIEVYPLSIWIKFYIKDMGRHNIDNDNKWPWRKWFQDTAVEMGILSDDNLYIINDNRETTYLIPDDQEQKMEIIVYGNRN